MFVYAEPAVDTPPPTAIFPRGHFTLVCLELVLDAVVDVTIVHAPAGAGQHETLQLNVSPWVEPGSVVAQLQVDGLDG